MVLAEFAGNTRRVLACLHELINALSRGSEVRALALSRSSSPDSFQQPEARP